MEFKEFIKKVTNNLPKHITSVTFANNNGSYIANCGSITATSYKVHDSIEFYENETHKWTIV
jgi:hypothetical protein